MQNYEWTFFAKSRDGGVSTIQVVAAEYRVALIAAAAEAARFSTRITLLEFAKQRPVTLVAA